MIIMNEKSLEPIFKAANSLILELHITDGNALSFVLGQPDAETNKEAICLWILSYARDGRVGMERYVLLKTRLRYILSSLQGSQFA